MYNEAQFIGSDWLNRVKHLKSPQPELLNESITFSLIKLICECENPFIDKPMVITEPTYQGFETVLNAAHVQQRSFSTQAVFLECVKMVQATTSSAGKVLV